MKLAFWIAVAMGGLPFVPHLVELAKTSSQVSDPLADEVIFLPPLDHPSVSLEGVEDESASDQ